MNPSTDRSVPAPRRRSLLRIVVALLGIGALIALIAWHGFGDVLTALEAAGPRLFLVVPLFAPALAFTAAEWGCCFPPRTVPPGRTLVIGAWVMYGVNWLLPVARIGGEIARVRLLIGRGLSAAPATASVVVDKTVQVLGQAVFTVAGLALFAFQASDGRVLAAAGVVTLGLIATALLLIRVQRRGLFGRLHRFAERIVPKSRRADFGQGALSFDEAILAVWEHRGRLAGALTLHLGFRAVQVAETWLLLRFFGYELSPSDAFVLESLSQAVRAAAFLVPGALGVQEGAFVALGSTFGLPGDIALSTSLGKRLRELLVGLPGLSIWWLDESRKALAAQVDRPVEPAGSLATTEAAGGDDAGPAPSA